MSKNQLQRVSPEQAAQLYVAGFDWPCEHYYKAPDFDRKDWRADASIPAPTVALALKWARDVKGITHFISRSNTFSAYTINGFCGALYGTYEAAESALLDELLKLIENG